MIVAPYRVVYLVKQDVVWILTVFRSSMLLPTITEP